MSEYALIQSQPAAVSLHEQTLCETVNEQQGPRYTSATLSRMAKLIASVVFEQYLNQSQSQPSVIHVFFTSKSSDRKAGGKMLSWPQCHQDGRIKETRRYLSAGPNYANSHINVLASSSPCVTGSQLSTVM